MGEQSGYSFNPSLGLTTKPIFGWKKTALQHVLTAAAINLIRIDAILSDKKAAKTRVSRVAALAPVVRGRDRLICPEQFRQDGEACPRLAQGMQVGITAFIHKDADVQ